MINKNKKRLKDAYIEQVLIWLILFIGFASLLFFVINYAIIVRVKDNMDALADYSVRKISNNGATIDFIDELNNMSLPAINTIDAADINCATTANSSYKVIFNITTTNNSYKFFGGKLSSTRAVFNNSNSSQVDCDMTITLSD